MTHHGKIALVTGAAQGLGLAIAQKLRDEGAEVICLDRKAAPAGEAGIHSLIADLGGLTAARAEDLLEQATRLCGSPDILVNNAGIITMAPFLEFAADAFDQMLDINLRAPLLLSQAAARRMVAGKKGGAIVNLSSVTAELAAPGAAGYCASKGALRQLTRVMALELIDHGIRVNAVGPGTIRTEMAERILLSDPERHRMALSRIPAGRMGEPSEIADAVSYLASDAASYIVGQTIYVDGGRLVLNFTVPEPGAGAAV